MSNQFNTIIVGAGITGLTIAKNLCSRNTSIAVIEKSKSCGGRLATRKVFHEGKKFSVDTGAQFMTVKSDIFSKHVVEPSLARSSLHVWRGFDTVGDGPRYASRLGWNGFLNNLYPHDNIYTRLLDTKVVSVAYDPHSAFQLDVVTDVADKNDKDKGRTTLTCKNLVLTMPLPQSLILLGEQFPYNQFFQESLLSELRKKQYHPCICIILVVRHGNSDKYPGVWRSSQEYSCVQWVASNRVKGINVQGDYKGSDYSAFTVHCTPYFSQKYYNETDKNVILNLILEELQRMTESVITQESIVAVDMKRWRFSLPIVKDTEDSEDINSQGFVGGTKQVSNGMEHKLVFAGDSFTREPCIEACFESAVAASSFLILQE